jgi:hypothetical protein
MSEQYNKTEKAVNELSRKCERSDVYLTEVIDEVI